MNSISIKPTLRNSANIGDVILRETSSTRMIFRGKIVNNKKEPSAPVRGTIIFQKKSISGNWSDYNELDLRRLKATEWVKIDLKCSGINKLISTVKRCQKIYERDGIGRQNRKYVFKTGGESKNIKSLLKDEKTILDLIKHDSAGVVIATLKWLSESDEHQAIISKLQELDVKKLSRVNSMLGIANMKAILQMWENNKDNSKEEFWHQLFTKHPWVISQIFASPVTIFEAQAYVGGKRIDNKMGKVVDFLYENSLTENIILVEIKTPATLLMSSTKYRKGIYSVSTALTGTVNQVLSYREELQRSYHSLVSGDDISFRSFNPKCVVIAGSLCKLETLQLESFELLRRELNNVEILTYDEVFERIRFFLEVLEKDTQ